jgi:hypothetical protein
MCYRLKTVGFENIECGGFSGFSLDKTTLCGNVVNYRFRKLLVEKIATLLLGKGVGFMGPPSFDC